MKKTYILAIVMIVAAVAILVSATKDVSSYATFTKAALNSSKVKVAGILSKDKDIVYNPEVDANYFSFFLSDDDGIEKKVVYKGAKPQDFERSEQVVVTGTMKGDEFVASDMLLKCPSKYKEEEIYLKSEG